MNAIEIRNLTKSFRGMYALNGLNMTVPQGAIYGFIGENGSGKSTVTKGFDIIGEYINADESGIFDFNFQIALKQTLGELYNREPTLGNMYALSLFYKILSNHEQSKVLKNPYVEEAVWYMHMNYHKPLTVTQVADVCGINDRYMYNLFMRHLGISPKQYLNNLRLKNAAHILKNSDCTITEAAYSVGFTDVLTFSRFFSKHMEVSPRAYRKRRKSEVLN